MTMANRYKQYISNYQSMPKPVLMTLLSIFSYFLGYANVIFLPLYFNNTLHYSITQSSVMLSLFGFGTIIASLYGGKLCDTYSAYTVSVFSIIIYFISLILIYFISHPIYLIGIVLFILGIGNAAFSPASRLHLMNQTPLLDQARINNIRYLLLNAGTASSFGIATIIIKTEYKNVFLFAIFSCILSLIFLPVGRKKTIKNINTHTNIHYWNNSLINLTLIGFFSTMLAFIQTNSTYTLFLSTHYHLMSSNISILFLINALIIISSQLTIFHFTKTLSQPLVMCIGSLTMGIGFLILLFGNTYFIAIVSMIVITLGEILFIPTVQYIVYHFTQPHLKGHYAGVYQAIYASTLMLAPLLGGFALKYSLNGRLLWSFTFVLCLIPIIIFSLLKILKIKYNPLITLEENKL